MVAFSMSVKKAFDFFLLDCKARNLRPDTVRSDVSHLHFFLDWFGQKDVESVGRNEVSSYLLKLNEIKLSEVTVRTYMRALKVFLRFCFANEWTPSFHITLPRATKTPKNTFTEDELKLLLKKPSVVSDGFSEYKIWVLSNCLLSTGCRISSLLNLKVCDIDFSSELILLSHNKDRLVHVIPLLPKLKPILIEYLGIRSGNDYDYVFCNMYGGFWDVRSAERAMEKYSKNRGVLKHGFHIFRHTFAKMWILKGGDIFRLQKILGHKDLTMVKEYVEMFDIDIRTGFNSFNPLDQILPSSCRISPFTKSRMESLKKINKKG